MASRQQSIKVKIILLLVVPLAALLMLWVFAASSSFGDTMLLLKAKSVDSKIIRPTQGLIISLQGERRLSLAALGAGHEADRSALAAQRNRTDAARVAFQRDIADGGLRDGLSADLRRRMDGLSGRLGELDALRGAVDVTGIGRSTVLSEFDSLIDSAFAIYNAVSTGNAEIAREVRTLTGLARARELLAREDALVAGVLAARHIAPAERDTIAQLVGSQRFQYTETVPLLATADRDRFQAFMRSPEFLRFRAIEDSLMRGGRIEFVRGSRVERLPVKAAEWDASATQVLNRLNELGLTATDNTAERAWSIAIGVLVRLGLTGGLGLLALIASVVIAVRISRKVIGEVRSLSGVVEDFTTRRLPELTERLRQGELIEEVETGPERTFTVSEIGRLSGAFDDARHAVVAGARSEAAARKGVSEVFVNLARRNQALLHRQLGLLDAMERRVEDPQDLDELFRLDHLATCMRRHAEGLVILAGRTAGRTWRTPVPLIDVVRGAVAEVEDYTRVQVLPMPRAALTGTAVADTIHLLAELIENAAMFSPPQAPVQVTGHAVPNGFVVEVEDRGLGMSPDLMAELNGRLTEAPEFDLLDSARLGMFVVARLAHRHDIQVALRPSPYGGTTAIVLVPATLIVSEDLLVPPPVPEVSGGTESRRPIAVAPDPVEAIDAVDSTVPSFIIDAARKQEPGASPAPPPGKGPAPGRPAADPAPATGADGAGTDRTGANRAGTDRAGTDRAGVLRTGVNGGTVAGSLAGHAPVSRRPAAATPGERPEPDAGTHLGMPRRRRKPVVPAGEPAPGGTETGTPVGAEAHPQGQTQARTQADPGGAGSADGQDTYLGMPRRTRQASLAPQLRGDSWEPTEDEVKNDSGSDRSPEELGARMAAMQSGWQRGRGVAEPTTDPATDPATESAAERVAERPEERSPEVPVGPAVRPAKEEDTP